MSYDVPKVLYLHGFASSPNSRKASFFASQLAACGVAMEALALEQNDFAHLTLTSELGVIERAAGNRPVILIGSSLGGYLACLFAARNSRVQKLILLAPAFCFRQLWERELGAEKMAEWRKKGSIPVFHYGRDGQMDLRFDLMEDAQKYEPYPEVRQPCLVFHGDQDPVVPLAFSEAFAQSRPNCRLFRMASGHELTGVLDEIWKESKPFLLSPTYDLVPDLDVPVGEDGIH